MEQNEIDELMKNAAQAADVSSAADEKLGWDDVKEEMEQSSHPVEQKTEVSSVHFEELQRARPEGKPNINIDFIMDIPLTLTAELGRSKMLISELLQLGQGSVLELSKLAGEPMDIFVNQRLIARGEVVVVNEKFGVRLTDIVSPAERVNKLG
ncbi:MAG TPA: flagellar motor switch protein FliN [Smithellaceae bacterium]|jgi:flagellar motor switch protein FliN/FliY|nr:flagellar motor switch protein FliN [Syntrophaceae bacterium]HPV48816.1 flagellar motor switch protein FliN [Smithellaceae bacterium]